MSAATSRREPDWVGVPDALERILAAASPTAAESVPLAEAAQRVLADAVSAPMPHPPWDNSAMDGFAVRAADVRGAAAHRPVRLRVVDDVPAGGFPTRPVGPGEAVRVMTGAPMPEGADGVIRIEHTNAWDRADRPAEIDVLRDDDAGRNVRHRGEDYGVDDPLIDAGAVLTPARVGLLAAIGVRTVAVRRRPLVAILATGDELAGPDDLDAVRAGRRIADSNSPALAAAVHAAGGIALPLGIARDEADDIGSRLEDARDADMLLTTAGASVGDHDLVKEALDQAGFALDFWRVRMRPGSPFSFGRLGRTLVLGLPGNPVSALVTFEILGVPALRALLGRTDPHSAVRRVLTDEPIPTRGGLAHFLRVRLTQDGNGPARVRLTGPQGSGILTSMSRADALLVVPEDVEGLPQGAEADAIPLGNPLIGRETLGYTTRLAPAEQDRRS